MAWEWPVPKAWTTPSVRTQSAISSAARDTESRLDSVMCWRTARLSRAKVSALTDSADTRFSPPVDQATCFFLINESINHMRSWYSIDGLWGG